MPFGQQNNYNQGQFGGQPAGQNFPQGQGQGGQGSFQGQNFPQAGMSPQQQGGNYGNYQGAPGGQQPRYGGFPGQQSAPRPAGPNNPTMANMPNSNMGGQMAPQAAMANSGPAQQQPQQGQQQGFAGGYQQQGQF